MAVSQKINPPATQPGSPVTTSQFLSALPPRGDLTPPLFPELWLGIFPCYPKNPLGDPGLQGRDGGGVEPLVPAPNVGIHPRS